MRYNFFNTAKYKEVVTTCSMILFPAVCAKSTRFTRSDPTRLWRECPATENGVLKAFMLPLYVANKTGFAPAKNTSSAVVIEGGDTPYSDMIKHIKKGLIVGRFSGGEPGTNGDFSGVAKNSFLIEDGMIRGAVSETMINGNLAELLNSITDISKETVCDGTSVLPYIAFDHVVISGK